MVQGRQQLPKSGREGSTAGCRHCLVATSISPKIGWAIAHPAQPPSTPLWSKNIQKHTWLPRGQHWPHRKMKRLRIVGPLKHHPLPRPNCLGNGLQQKMATTQILGKHKKIDEGKHIGRYGYKMSYLCITMLSVFDMGVKIRPSMYVKAVLYQTNSNHWSSKAPSTAAPKASRQWSSKTATTQTTHKKSMKEGGHIGRYGFKRSHFCKMYYACLSVDMHGCHLDNSLT